MEEEVYFYPPLQHCRKISFDLPFSLMVPLTELSLTVSSFEMLSLKVSSIPVLTVPPSGPEAAHDRHIRKFRGTKHAASLSQTLEP